MTSIASRAGLRSSGFPHPRKALCASLALLLVHSGGLALPTGAVPTFGSTTLSNGSASQMTIVQGTDRAGIDWRSFSIAAGERLSIVQPGSQSILFNRVTGADPSRIFGQLQANGRVFLSNPAGVVFGAGSRVDVGALVATTLSLSDADMRASRFNLSGNGQAGELVQDGSINATGMVALVAPRLTQQGHIEAPRIGLAAAESVRVDVEGDGLIFFNVNTAGLDTRLKALGTLKADAGSVELRAQARAGFVDTVLNMDGVVMANSIGTRQGRVYIDGGSAGVTDVRGQVLAKGVADGEKGGSIAVLGQKVGLFDQALVDASGHAGGGTVLVGGNFQGSGVERTATATYVSVGARALADAGEAGDGGRVIVWSNEYTRMDGLVAARGGLTGGAGGFVEVSGKDRLSLTGGVDVGAFRGAAGQVLLDPTSLKIDNSANVRVTTADPLTPDAADPLGSTLTWATISGLLTGGTAVTITTVGSPANGTDAGNITITASNTASASPGPAGPGALVGTGLLTFEAAGGIVVNANASITRSTAGAMAFKAAGAGGIDVRAGISSNGGNLTLSALGTAGSAGDVVLAGDLGVGAGTVRLGSAGGNIRQTAGAITALNLSANAPLGTVVLPTASNVVSGQLAGTGKFGFGYKNTGALTVGTVSADSLQVLQTGIGSTDGNIALSTAGALVGALVMNDAVTASTGAIGLESGAAITVNEDLTAGTRLVLRGTSLTNPSGTISVGTGVTGGIASDGLSSASLTTVLAPLTQRMAVNVSGNYELRLATGNLVVPVIAPVTVAQGSATLSVAGLSGISANAVRLEATAGNISQEAGAVIQATTRLTARAGGDITLGEANTVDSATPTLGLNAGGDLLFASSGGYTIGGLDASGGFAGVQGVQAPGDTVELSAATGTVRQATVGTSTILAQNLLLGGSASYLLTNLANSVSTLTASSGVASDGSIQYVNAGVLAVGSVTPNLPGIVRSGDVAVRTVTGNLTLNKAIDVRTGLGKNIELEVTQAGASLSQAMGANVLTSGTGGLLLRGQGSVTLDNPGNNVGVLAARGDATDGVLHYVDADELKVDTITPVTGGAPLAGMVRNNDISLQVRSGSTKDLTLAQDVNAGTARIVRLDSVAGNIWQSDGVITAYGLSASALAGSVVLPSANAVSDLLAGKAASGFGFKNQGILTVGSVPADALLAQRDGVEATAGNVALVSGAALRVNERVMASVDLGLQALTSIGVAANVSAGTRLVLRGTSLNRTGGTISVGTDGSFASDGLDAGSLAPISLPNRVAIHMSDDFSMLAGPGDLVIADIGPVIVAQGNASGPVTVGGVSGVTANAVRLQADSGSIRQDAGALIQADTLLAAKASGSILLGEANRVGPPGTNTALLALQAGGNIRFTEAGGGYTIGDARPATVASVAGVQAGASDTIELTTTGLGEVLQDTAAASKISASKLLLHGLAGYRLENTDNGVVSIAADSAGANDGVLRYVNLNDLTVDAVVPVGGSTLVKGITRTNDVTLHVIAAGRDLSLVEAVNVGTTGTVRLSSVGGSIWQDGGPITALNLSAAAPTGRVVLPSLNNDVTGHLAGVAQLGFGFQGTSAVTLTVDTVPQDPDIAAVSERRGIEATAGNVALVNTTALTLNQPVTASDAVGLETAGAINVAANLSAGSRMVLRGSSLNRSAGPITVGPGGLASDGLGQASLAVITGLSRRIAVNTSGDYALRVATGDLVVPVIASVNVPQGSASGPVTVRGLSGIQANSVRLQADTGSILQEAGALIQTESLLAAKAGSSILLGEDNRVGPGNVNTTALALNAGVNVLFTEAFGGYTIDTVSASAIEEVPGLKAGTTGTIELITPVGDVLQGIAAMSTITGGALLLRGVAGYALLHEGNDVGLIAASGGALDGVLRYVNANALKVDTITPVAGGTPVAGVTRNNDVGLRTVTDNLTLNQSIDVRTGMGKNIELELTQSGSALTQGAGKNVLTSLTGGLLLRGQGSVTLDNETNNVGLLAASGGVTDGVLRYVDADVLKVDAIIPVAGGIAVAGILRNDHVRLRTVTQDLMLNEAIDVRTGAGKNIELDLTQAGAALTQAADKSVLTSASGGLLLRGQGSVSLTNLGNDVGLIAASGGALDGVLRYVNASALKVDTITPVAEGTPVAGITRNNDVGLRTVTDNLTLNQSIDVRTGMGKNIELELTQSGSALTQGAGKNVLTSLTGGLLLRGQGSVTLDNETNNVGLLAASGGVTDGVLRYVDADVLKVDAIIPVAGGTAVAGIVRSNHVGLRTVAGDLTLNESVNVSSGAAKNIEFELTQAGAALSQAAGKSVLTSASGGLLLHGQGSVTLLNESNDVGLLAASGGVTDGVLRYVDANALKVDSIIPVASGAAVAGITRNNDVGLRTVTDNLTLNQSIDVRTGAGKNIELDLTQAGAALTQAADKSVLTSASGGLLLRGQGSASLLNESNDVGLLAASGGVTDGVLRYVDANALMVDAIVPMSGGTAVAGIMRNNDVGLRTVTDNLTLNQTIDVSAGVGKNIELELTEAGSALGQAAGKSVLTSASGGLLLRGQGSVSLLNESNDVGLLAASGGVTDGVLRYVDANDLTVDAIVPRAGGVAVAGITRNNHVGLRTVAGDLTLNESVNISAGAAKNIELELTQAGTALTQLAGKNVLSGAGGGLLLRGAGAYVLTNAGNSVTTLAADSAGTSDGAIDFVNAGALTVGSVTPAAANSAAGAGITRSNDVTLRNLGGDLGLAASISVGMANVRLQSAGSILQGTADSTGAITAGSLGARAAGDVKFGRTSNAVSTFSAAAGDHVLFRESNGYTIDALGVSVHIVVGGADGVIGTPVFTATSGILAGSGKTIELLTAAGTVDQTKALGAQNLLLRGSGAYTLTNRVNSVSTLAADSGVASDSTLQYTNLGSLAVGKVTLVTDAAVDVKGITRSGDLVLTSLAKPNAPAAQAAGDMSLQEIIKVDAHQATLTIAGELNVKDFTVDGNLTATAAGAVNLDGNFQAMGDHRTVSLITTKAAVADATLRTQEIAAFVQGEPIVVTPIGTRDVDGSLIAIASAVIKQNSGTVKVTGDSTLNLVSANDKSGSITLDNDGNDFSTGYVTARSIASAAAAATTKLAVTDAAQRVLSRIEIIGTGIRIGDSGAKVDVPRYSESLPIKNIIVGIEGDLVRFGAGALSTDQHYIVARYRASSTNINAQLPGLAIEMKDPANFPERGFSDGKFLFGDVGSLSTGATGEGSGIKVVVGYDTVALGYETGAVASATESAPVVAWIALIPRTVADKPDQATGLDQFRAKAATISLSGPVQRTNYLFSAPGYEINVPVYYNSATAFNSAQLSALSAIDLLQEKLRREQLERSVSTENVATELREGVIVRVGRGNAATKGEGEIKQPPSCEPAGGSTACGAAPQ